MVDMIKRQYILPRSESEELDALDALLSGGTANEQIEEGAEPGGEADPPAESEPEPDDPEDVPAVPEDTKKANNAFAQMRLQNKQMHDLVTKIAQATGIQYNDDTELLEKLNGEALEKLAKAQNVPVELLQRMESLEQYKSMYEQDRLKNEALAGFQSIQTQYGLSNEELQNFAAELDENGLNPFSQEVDVIAQYKLSHYDDIVEKKVAEAVAKALSKSGEADKHSSTPGSVQGKPDSTGVEKISTVTALNNFLDGK